MHKIYFPIHLDGGNRGCEGIAKGSAQILSLPQEQMLGLCTDIPLDKRLGVGNHVTLLEKPQTGSYFRFANRLYNIATYWRTKDNYQYTIYRYRYTFRPFLSRMKRDDIMLITGGDMMCYEDNEIIYMTDYAKRHKVKAVLWGCSMGRRNLTPRKQKTLGKFDMIYARESLSYEFFKSMGLENVVCLPDPAFVLEPEEVELPECFSKGDVIGLNLSNYTIGADTLDTAFGKEVIKFLDHILANTDKHILLVPHVFWWGQDDRIISRLIVEHYANHAERFTLLDSENLNYLQIRHVISHCHCFIGARTHAVISAYATCTPAIALGYSIKSKGIAKDLQLSEELVVDCVKDIKPDCLIKSYQYLTENHDTIRQTLCSLIPDYRKKPFEARDILFPN